MTKNFYQILIFSCQFLDGHVASQLILEWYTDNPRDSIVIPENVELAQFEYKLEVYPQELMHYKTGIWRTICMVFGEFRRNQNLSNTNLVCQNF